jgi:hypothetical protein
MWFPKIWKKVSILVIMVLALLVPTAVMGADTINLTTQVDPEIISFTVNPTDLDFGTIIVGGASTRTFNLYNTGNVPVTFFATNTGEFYTACMTLDGSTISGFTSVNILPGTNVLVTAVVVANSAWIAANGTGVKSGSLTFLATKYTP